MKDIHPIQLQILKKLLFAKSLRYSELKPDKDLENNKFDFHLDQMISASFIKKTTNQYLLTSLGKEFANRMDTEKTTIIKQAKLSVFICPVKKVKGENYYLIYTRLKQPFYGCQGFMSGKINYGDTPIDSAIRELREETGLNAKIEIVGIRQYRVFDETSGEFLEDKFMFLCIAKNPRGKIVPSEEGMFEWVKESDLKTYMNNHFVSEKQFEKDISDVKYFNGNITFEIIDHKTSKF